MKRNPVNQAQGTIFLYANLILHIHTTHIFSLEQIYNEDNWLRIETVLAGPEAI